MSDGKEFSVTIGGAVIRVIIDDTLDDDEWLLLQPVDNGYCLPIMGPAEYFGTDTIQITFLTSAEDASQKDGDQ